MKNCFFAVMTMLFCMITLSSCDKKNITNTNSQNGNQPAYARLIEDKTLRVGYISYPPSFIKDANSGKYSGIFYDVLQKVGENMEIKVDYVEEVSWGSMVEAVNSGRVDLVCTGIWPTSTRGKLADFTNPIYFSPVKAYVKAGNNNFDGKLDAINTEKVKISAIDGEMTSIIARFDFPKAKLVSLSQSSDVSQVLLDVVSGKADITFVEPVIANEFLANNPNTIKEVQNVAPLRVFPNVLMVAKGESKLLSALNVAIEELANNGFVDKAINKYEKYPNSFFKRQLPYRQ